MDPTYVPAKLETRQVYGVSLQQNRNDAKITPELFSNIVSTNKDVSNVTSTFHLATNFVVASKGSSNRPHCRNASAKVYAI